MHRELTPREVDVLRLVGHGASNDQIAAKLNLSSRTVANHLRHAYEKLGVNDRRSAYARMVNRYPEYAMTMDGQAVLTSPRDVDPAPNADLSDTRTISATSLYGLYAGLGKYRTPGLLGVPKLSLILRVAGSGLILLAALAGLLSVFQIFDPGAG